MIVALLLVALLAACSAPAPEEADAPTVTVAGFSFEPASVEVDAGEAVLWDNRDGAEHTATGAGGAFDVSLPAGASGEHTFADPGTYPYACAIHPSMTGEVVVH